MRRVRTFRISTAKPLKADLQSTIINEDSKVEKQKIDRINELGRLSKERELSAEEKAEQKALREEYLKEVRAALKGK